jgi:hypothetical protein
MYRSRPAQISQNRRRFLFISAIAAYSEIEVTQRAWKKPWLFAHDEQGAYQNLVKMLRGHDQEAFRNYFRMDETCFRDLLSRVKPLIEKHDTNYRRAIPAEERLAIALRWPKI